MEKMLTDIISEGKKRTRGTIRAISEREGDRGRGKIFFAFSGASTTGYIHAVLASYDDDTGEPSPPVTPVCKWNQRRAEMSDPTWTESGAEAIHWSREFCRLCANMVSASVRVRMGYGPTPIALSTDSSRKKMEIYDPEMTTTYQSYIQYPDKHKAPWIIKFK